MQIVGRKIDNKKNMTYQNEYYVIALLSQNKTNKRLAN
jgi:hypothetical protein